MTRSAASLVGLLLLAACVQNIAGTPVEVYTHCGLGFITIAYEGKAWKFDDVVDSGNPPDGWANGDEIVYLEEISGQLIAHGPDGFDYRLVERLEERPSGCL